MVRNRALLCALILVCIGGAAMADNDAYRKRSQELLENVEYKDISLRNIFYSFLDEFEDSYEPVLAGETTKEQLAMMAIGTDVKM